MDDPFLNHFSNVLDPLLLGFNVGSLERHRKKHRESHLLLLIKTTFNSPLTGVTVIPKMPNLGGRAESLFCPLSFDSLISETSNFKTQCRPYGGLVKIFYNSLGTDQSAIGPGWAWVTT